MQDRPAPIQDDATAPPHARGAHWERRRYLSFERNGVTTLIALTREVTHIGSGLSVDVHLDDKSVSRRHALIVRQPDGLRVLDDRSLNGVFVNGERVEWSTLADGDEIVIGRHHLHFVDVPVVSGMRFESSDEDSGAAIGE